MELVVFFSLTRQSMLCRIWNFALNRVELIKPNHVKFLQNSCKLFVFQRGDLNDDTVSEGLQENCIECIQEVKCFF